MENIYNWIGKNIGKAIGVPIVLNSVEFILMLAHSLSDGVISHDELEALLKAGDGINLAFLAIVLAYLKFKK